MLKMGEIISINETQNNIKVKDSYDASTVDIPLNNILQLQIMPIIGDIVLYLNMQDKIFQIIKVWSIKNSELLRQGETPLRSGETQLTGILGQYIYLDRNGDIKFVDSSLLNEFELTIQGFIAKLKNFNITTYDGITIEVGKDLTFSRGKNTTATINDDGVELQHKNVSVIIDNNGTITIKGGKVQLGNQLYGDIVTSGPSGTYPFCPITGNPIMGSNKCKCEG